MYGDFFDISSTVFDDCQTDLNTFNIPRVEKKQLCNVSNDGLGVNCYQLDRFCVHSTGTHTECARHVYSDIEVSIGNVVSFINPLMTAALITVDPEPIANVPLEMQLQAATKGKFLPSDLVISRKSIEQAIDDLNDKSLLNQGSIRALVIRRRDLKSHNLDYSGTNPPYLTLAAAKFISHELSRKYQNLNIKHLLVDLPSVDREDDGGLVLAHKQLFSKDLARCTITELCLIPEEVTDDVYNLNLQFLNWKLGDMDAVPNPR